MSEYETVEVTMLPIELLTEFSIKEQIERIIGDYVRGQDEVIEVLSAFLTKYPTIYTFEDHEKIEMISNLLADIISVANKLLWSQNEHVVFKVMKDSLCEGIRIKREDFDYVVELTEIRLGNKFPAIPSKCFSKIIKEMAKCLFKPAEK